MISVYDIDIAIEYLSKLIYYGLENRYSFKNIEEIITASDFNKELELGDASILYNLTNEDIIKQAYKINNDISIHNDVLSMWLGEIYIKLFFALTKSFNYLFLYFPIEDAIKAFNVYHEMDFSQIINHFQNLTNHKSILSILLKNKNISARELSLLTSIKYNTIISYTRDNENIYNAKYEKIYLISHALKVNPNIFLKKINISTIKTFAMEQNDLHNYYCHYATFITCYFDSSIKNRGSFDYIEIDNFKNLKTLIDSYHVNKNILVIFINDDNIDDNLLSSSNIKYEKIIIINQSTYLSITKNKKYKRIIPDVLYESASNYAKNMANIDFIY